MLNLNLNQLATIIIIEWMIPILAGSLVWLYMLRTVAFLTESLRAVEPESRFVSRPRGFSLTIGTHQLGLPQSPPHMKGR